MVSLSSASLHSTYSLARRPRVSRYLCSGLPRAVSFVPRVNLEVYLFYTMARVKKIQTVYLSLSYVLNIVTKGVEGPGWHSLAIAP